MTINTIAPHTETEPPSENKKSVVTAKKSRIALGAKDLLSTAIGIKTTLIARMSAVLQMTEPMPLPIAIPTFSCEAAI